MQEPRAYPFSKQEGVSREHKQQLWRAPHKIHDRYARIKAGRLPARSLQSSWLLWPTALLTAVLFFRLSVTVAEPKPEAETWKINGALAAVQDANAEVQVKGLDKWRGLKSPSTISHVSAVLKDKDGSVRSAAVKALGAMGEAAKEQVPKIVDLLDDPDRNVRLAAVKALGAMGEAAKEQVPKIGNLLKHSDGRVRLAAVRALGAMGESARAQVLKIADLLDDPEREVRLAAVQALGAMRAAAKEQVATIIDLLMNSDGDVRFTAVQALGTIGEGARAQVPKIVDLLDNPDRNVRLAAVQALWAMGEAAKEQVPKIADRLHDPEREVRLAAVQALGAMGAAAKEQVATIVDLLMNSDGDVRLTAVQALGAMGEAAKEQVPQLVDLLTHPNGRIRLVAVRALGAMGAAVKEQTPKIAELLKSPDRDVRSVAVQALGAMGEAAKEQVPQLVHLLHDPDRNVRLDAVRAFWAMGAAAKEQAPRIAHLLKSHDIDVRFTATQALGAMGEAAKEQVPQLVDLLNDPDTNVRLVAVRALGVMGEAAKEQVPQLVDLLNDRDRNIRFAAIDTLGALGTAAKEQTPKIVDLLKNPDKDVRFAAAQVLGVSEMGPLDIQSILNILSLAYDNPWEVSELRFLAHFLGGGDKAAEILIQWLGMPDQYPQTIARTHGISTLQVFAKVWESSTSLPRLRTDLERQLAAVIHKVEWEKADLDLLKLHARNLKSRGSIYTTSVLGVIASLDGRRWELSDVVKILIAHTVFWLLLVFAYPISPQIQAIFFWNPWVRRILGLGYVGFALTWVPYLRSKLFAPFKASLLADATLEGFDPQAYFEDSEVRLKDHMQPIKEAIPEIRGQIVLEGESGLGKTMFLRHLVQRSKRLVVYLPAEKCSQGVIEAIQAKLHGPAKDSDLLRNLIYSGAIDICIDGLNQVTADTRARVKEFVESYFKGNVLLATQPLEWTPPSTAKIYIMQPLKREQIEHFLLTRRSGLPEDAIVRGGAYELACVRYLAETLDEHQPAEVLASAKRMLSNPMDLTIVAQMLAHGQKPDLLRLQEQDYYMMAADYERIYVSQEFPLAAFSEQIYQMRLKGEDALPAKEFFEELRCMERHKMVLSRQSLDAQGNPTKEWHFRHDKIMEFFLVQTFLGADNDRPQQHLGDPRFRGVYFLLAMLLPLEDSEALRERLIQYAADTQDHLVSDTFIRLLRSRQAA